MSSQALDDFETRLAASLTQLVDRAEVPDVDAVDLIGRASDAVVVLGVVDPSGISRRRSRWPSVAAAVLLIVGLVVVARIAARDEHPEPPAGESEWLVLPGERVLSIEPLAVTAAPGPEPRFDTTPLGDELVFEPLGDMDPRLIAAQPVLEMGGEVRKIVLLGHNNGVLYWLVIQDRDGVRERVVLGEGGGPLWPGRPVDVDSLELIAFPGHDEWPVPSEVAGYGVSPDGRGKVVWDLLPSDVAVVAYSDAESRIWTRPLAGVAVVPNQLALGERFELIAYSATGERLGSASGTLDLPPEAFELQPGTNVGPIRGYDAAANDVLIGSDGRTKVLIFGASWCAPCAPIPGIVEAALEAHPGVEVYAVDSGEGPDASPWPVGDAWTGRRVFPIDSPLPIAALPVVYVLDGHNAVIGTHVGGDGLAESLDQLLP